MLTRRLTALATAAVLAVGVAVLPGATASAATTMAPVDSSEAPAPPAVEELPTLSDTEPTKRLVSPEEPVDYVLIAGGSVLLLLLLIAVALMLRRRLAAE
jgi:hypothetical protein